MNRSSTPIVTKIAVWTVLTLGAVLMSLPFLWLLSSALKSPSKIWQYPPQWIPNPFVFSNFTEALTKLPFGRYFVNTMYIVVVREVGILLASSFCAYGFARLRFVGRDLIFVILLSTIMIPDVVLIVPRYVMFSKLNWIDTFLPLIIPPLFGGGAFNIFLMRQFFRSVPGDLSDAAKIDGCSHPTIYARIMLPLAKPAMATIGIFTFLGAWNEFMGPLMYLISPEKLTVALGLAQFRGLYTTEWHLLMAASVATILPVIVIFFIGQRYFIEGAMISGIKG